VTIDTSELIVYLAALRDRDREQLAALLDEDFVTEIPQSGERNRGADSFLAELEAYPGGGPVIPSASEVHVLEDEERWAMTPGFTVVPLASPDEFTVTYRMLYPDGQWWHVVCQMQLRGDKLYRMETYFAPELPAPLAESIATFSRG
jgi:SnoaL-like domain